MEQAPKYDFRFLATKAEVQPSVISHEVLHEVQDTTTVLRRVNLPASQEAPEPAVTKVRIY
jgi:hypothetical protein